MGLGLFFDVSVCLGVLRRLERLKMDVCCDSKPLSTFTVMWYYANIC